MDGADRQAALGRAMERLVEIALADDALRPGLEALARHVLDVLERQALAADIAADLVAAITPLADEAVRELIATDAVAAEAGAGAPEVGASAEAGDATPAEDVTAPAAPALTPEEERAARRRASREAVPMDRNAFLSLLENVVRDFGASDRGSLVEAALGGGDPDTIAALDRAGRAEPAADAPDAPLPGIVTRARLRAAVARDVAEHVRTGRALDIDHVHRARSEGAAVWMTDLLQPDPDAVTVFAECLDALADCADMVVLLGRYEPEDWHRRSQAVKDLAAVQSALRIATLALRQTPDDEQVAAFAWANLVTKSERIFVERHMRLDDPLDPGHLADVMEPVHQGLAALRERADRDAAVRKRYQQLTYLARRLREGKASGADLDKLVEAVVALVDVGLPPSSIRLRDVLEPVAARLPDPEGRPAAYGRTIAELHRHLERVGRAQAEAELAEEEAEENDDDVIGGIDCPSAAVAVARAHLHRVVIPEAATIHTADLDGTPSSVAWGRNTWRALRALEAYAHAGTHNGFWDWCERSGHPFAWPASPNRLAMYESDTVLRQYREDRLFPVDAAVSPDGEVEMLAHCKIADNGGRLTPRLYFHDDTKGATGKVHVGFIGPHHLVRNAGLN